MINQAQQYLLDGIELVGALIQLPPEDVLHLLDVILWPFTTKYSQFAANRPAIVILIWASKATASTEHRWCGARWHSKKWELVSNSLEHGCCCNCVSDQQHCSGMPVLAEAATSPA